MPDGDYVDFRLSPDDARLAASLANSKTNVVEVWLFDWSLDGHIVFSGPSRAAGNDLWLLPLGEEGKVSKFLGSPAEELRGNFSPDGRLLAYTSNESGKFEVYVETVPPSDRKWFVSTSGGYEPRWRADGREIFFLSEDRRLLSVAVGAGPSFGVPKVPVSDACGRKGHRAPAPSIRVVLNWTAALKK